MPNLFDLVWLCLPAFRLQIEDFFDSFSDKNMMAAMSPLLESQPQQQSAQSFKRNVGIRSASKNPLQDFVRADHI